VPREGAHRTSRRGGARGEIKDEEGWKGKEEKEGRGRVRSKCRKCWKRPGRGSRIGDLHRLHGVGKESNEGKKQGKRERRKAVSPHSPGPQAILMDPTQIDDVQRPSSCCLHHLRRLFSTRYALLSHFDPFRRELLVHRPSSERDRLSSVRRYRCLVAPSRNWSDGGTDAVVGGVRERDGVAVLRATDVVVDCAAGGEGGEE
jgi:hypothetical protein